MVSLQLHSLSGSKRAGELAKLVDSLYRSGRQLLVWVADDRRRQGLDDYLWTFDKVAFVPHAQWDSSQDEADEPVLLLGQAANPNQAEILVIGDDLPPAEWAASFKEVHDLIPPGEAGAERTAWWQEWRKKHSGGAD